MVTAVIEEVMTELQFGKESGKDDILTLPGFDRLHGFSRNDHHDERCLKCALTRTFTVRDYVAEKNSIKLEYYIADLEPRRIFRNLNENE